jgi:hypothetical protein
MSPNRLAPRGNTVASSSGDAGESRSVDAAERRRAHNETLFREVNERVEEVTSGLAGVGDESLLLRLVCECGLEECTEPIELTDQKYESVRRDSRRFIVIPGHEHTDSARVVERHPDYLVVEKLGEAGEIATEQDSDA